MFKPKTLLKVVSILLIIFGSLLLIGTVLSVIGAQLLNSTSVPNVTQDMKDMVNDAYTPINITISIVSCLVIILSGILGLIGKSFKAALIAMLIYTIYLIVNLVMNIPVNGFSIFSIINFILPTLYFWGLYQSKE